jgi:hypothetical protein
MKKIKKGVSVPTLLPPPQTREPEPYFICIHEHIVALIINVTMQKNITITTAQEE